MKIAKEIFDDVHMQQNKLSILCIYLTDLSEKKSDLRVCDAGTCRFGGSCVENGGDIKCACLFKVSFSLLVPLFYIVS